MVIVNELIKEIKNVNDFTEWFNHSLNFIKYVIYLMPPITEKNVICGANLQSPSVMQQ